MNFSRKAVLAAVVVFAAAIGAAAGRSGDLEFADMNAEIGCPSKLSAEQKADLFNAKYAGKKITATGEVTGIYPDEVTIKILPSTYIFDLSVKLSDPKSALHLKKGQQITVTFIVRIAGGCILPYQGDRGAHVD